MLAAASKFIRTENDGCGVGAVIKSVQLHARESALSRCAMIARRHARNAAFPTMVNHRYFRALRLAAVPRALNFITKDVNCSFETRAHARALYYMYTSTRFDVCAPRLHTCTTLGVLETRRTRVYAYVHFLVHANEEGAARRCCSGVSALYCFNESCN